MFNIITPTFNRSHTLNRVYESLIQQETQQFDWIIVDDGSTDSTEELVKKWIQSNHIRIKYFKLSVNQGKSMAVNFGLDYCTHPYTIIADSDDSFCKETLTDLLFFWNAINILNDNTIAAIWTLTKDENGKIVGDKFPKNVWQVNFEERVLKNTIRGEKWACWKTSILCQFKMYALPNCHIQESQTWNSINKEYDFLCVNKAHRLYFNSSDGIMATKISKKKNVKQKYYNSYYGLKDVNIKDMISHIFFADLSFNYVAALLFYRDKKNQLTLTKILISCLIFLFLSPIKLFNKITC